MTISHTKFLRQLAPLFLILFVTLLYLPSLNGPFLFDDFPNLSALESIGHVSSWRDLGIYLSQPRGFPGRPIAMLSFLLQQDAWPDHPLSFRAVNIGLHLANGLLVFILVRQIAKHVAAVRVSEIDQTCTGWLAGAIAATAWLVNPVQLSGVALIVQRMTLLMALFTLLGLLAWLRGVLAEQLSIQRRAAWVFLGLGPCMLLAFLSKENGILLPLYALIIGSTVLRNNIQQLPRPLSILQRGLIWPVVAFVLGYLLWSVYASWGHSGTRDFTVAERLLTEPRILLDYLGKTFLPLFGQYGLYHDGYEVSRGWLAPWTTLPAILLLAAAFTAAMMKRLQWPLFAFATLWFLGGQLIESSSIMLELYFEHRNYVPLIGPMAAIGLGASRMPSGRLHTLTLSLLGAWLLACGFTAALSARIYASEDTLALTWANSQPESVRAQTYLAERLYKHGQLVPALETLDRVAKDHPMDTSIAINRAFLQCKLGELRSADVDSLARLVRRAPFNRGGFSSMESLRQLAENRQCAALDKDHWTILADAMLANPAYGKDGIAAGFLHYQKHFLAVSEGNLAVAVTELDAAWQMDPDANIPRVKAKYLASAGLYDQAIESLSDVRYDQLPLLRRLLVNDKAMDEENIQAIEQMRAAAMKAPDTNDTH